MVDSIRERIVQNLVTTLEGVTIANGYNFDIQRVHRIKMVGLNIKEYPAIVVIPADEPKEQVPVDRYTAKLSLELECWVREEDDISSEVNQVLADVEKALVVDHSRGGLAIDTTIMGNTPFYNETNKPHGGVVIRIEILYRHRYNDPYVLG